MMAPVTTAQIYWGAIPYVVIQVLMVALVLADAMLEKFGGDSLGELRRNYDGYVAALGRRWGELKR